MLFSYTPLLFSNIMAQSRKRKKEPHPKVRFKKSMYSF